MMAKFLHSVGMIKIYFIFNNSMDHSGQYIKSMNSLLNNMKTMKFLISYTINKVKVLFTFNIHLSTSKE